MALALTQGALGYAPAVVTPRAPAVAMGAKEELATALNPAIGCECLGIGTLRPFFPASPES